MITLSQIPDGSCCYECRWWELSGCNVDIPKGYTAKIVKKPYDECKIGELSYEEAFGRCIRFPPISYEHTRPRLFGNELCGEWTLIPEKKV